ncbi:signal peptidase I [Candidatus Marinamargulisbacteria bacterium SCGC AG-343-D04]|nr:signal peptidase I [Candidatus Marinamargulisbacteria bacterium SCGC AG-343-D04]
MLAKIRHRYKSWKTYKEALKKTHKFRYYVVDFVETILVALCIALFIKEFVIQVSVVPTGSMIPTLIGGKEGELNDRLFVSKFAYDFWEPERGDIVVFRSPNDDGKDYVKRLVGLPGETVEIKRGYVYINGKELILEGVDIQRDRDFYGPRVIEDSGYFMLGDNRSMSRDSRYWGFVNRDDIIGKALFTFWPFNRMKVLK